MNEFLSEQKSEDLLAFNSLTAKQYTALVDENIRMKRLLAPMAVIYLPKEMQ